MIDFAFGCRRIDYRSIGNYRRFSDLLFVGGGVVEVRRRFYEDTDQEVFFMNVRVFGFVCSFCRSYFIFGVLLGEGFLIRVLYDLFLPSLLMGFLMFFILRGFRQF